MPAAKSPALPALTSLRFFAALAIVIHHCNGAFWPAAELGPLDAGVSFFFVLSGFILTYVYRDIGRCGTAWKDFYCARIARIWPLHAVCLLLTILLVTAPEPFNPFALLANVLLLHAWLPWDRIFFSYNYVSWSISTELFFYLTFPFLMACKLRWILFGIAVSASIAVGLAGTAEWFDLDTWKTTANQLSATGLLYTDPLTRFAEFLIGMATARLFLRRLSLPQDTQLRWTLYELGSFALFCLGYLWLSSGKLINAAEQGGPMLYTLVTEWADHVALAPFAALLILVVAQQRGMVARALSQRWLVFAGEISFALYLVHQLFLRAMQSYVAHPGTAEFAWYMMTILVAAVLLHTLVERPARRWLVSRIGR